jgi:hypothetical protein
MAEGISEETSFPDSAENLQAIPARIGVIQFRIHGILDRMLAAAKNLAALITRMESRTVRGPPDYEMGTRPPGVYVRYDGNAPGPPPTQEPSWQKAISGIVGALIVVGIPAIFTVLWSMNTNQEKANARLDTIEEHQTGEHNLVIQRIEEQEKHLEAHDKRLDDQDKRLNEFDRAWPRPRH